MKIITRKEAIEQGLKRYFTGKPCKHGHVSERGLTSGCIECHNIKQRTDKARAQKKESTNNQSQRQKEIRKAYLKAYREDNKDKIKEHREANKDKKKAYYEANKDKLKARKKAYREANKYKTKAYYEAYQEANKDKLAEQQKAWRKANPLQQFTRSSLRRIESATGEDRINRAELELNYKQDKFKSHIESLWLDGMSWGNRTEWHIDHIKPLSLFIKEGITDPAIINALSNLQPLWAKDNLSKGARYNEETQCD